MGHADWSNATYIIGIDPGATTGIVVLAVTEDQIKIIDALQPNSHRAGTWLADELREGAVDAVAIERFTISTRTVRGTRSGALEALYTIGVIRYLCRNVGIPMVMQAPATAKNAFSDDRLRRLGLHRKTHGPHERDALRHALLYATTNGLWNGSINGNGEVA